MANTYVKIRQLEPSISPSSLLYTNGSNTPIYFAPSTGSDKGLFYDDSANSLAWHTYGAGLTMTGTVLTANVQSVNSQTGAVVLTTTNIAEGTNEYYTNEKVDDRVADLLKAGAGITLTYDDGPGELTISASVSGPTGYATIQDENSSLAQQTTLNFLGVGISAANDGANSRTNVTLDATLNALAAYNTNGILTQTAADTFVGRTLTAPAAGFTITNPDGVAGNPTFVLANDLAALEGLASTGFAVRTGSDTWAQRTINGTTNRVSVTNGSGVAGNTIIDVDAAYVGQTSINTLGTIGTGVWQGTSVGAQYGGTGQTAVNVGDLLYGSATNVWSRRAAGSDTQVLVVDGGLPTWVDLETSYLSDGSDIAFLSADQTFTGENTFVENVNIPVTPINNNHAASKQYVDSLVANQRTKQVRVATTANITLSGEQTIDDITTSASRVLVKNQSTQAQNGIYVSAAGAWTRATDMDTADEVDATFLVVEDGTLGAGTIWVTASEVTTLGTDAIVFTQINSATDIVAGAGLTKTGLTLDVGTASSSRIVVNADNIDLATTGVTPDTYGSNAEVGVFTVDAYGRITNASSTLIDIIYGFNVEATDPFTPGDYATTGNVISTGGVNFISGPGISLKANTTDFAVRVDHADTSSVSNLDTSAAQVIDTLTFDTFGHVTGVTTRNLTLADLGGAGDATLAYLEGSTATTVDLDSGTAVKDRNGNDISFTLPTNVDNFEVYRNGILQARSGTITTRDYQVNTGTNEITFVVALTADEIVIFKKR